MELTMRKAALEAILFSMGEAVPIARLAAALDEEEAAVKEALEELSEDYSASGRGIQLVYLEDACQLATKHEFYDQLSKLVNMPKKHVLTDVLLETLSIIAYKQPITRMEIEAIRGVSCVHAVNKLVEYNLVCEVGRLEAVGHPILFGTTDDFLRSFGVESKDDLPLITPDKIADFQRQAEAEASAELERRVEET